MSKDEDKPNNNLEQVGLEALRYAPGKVSWAVSQHIQNEDPIYSRIFVYCLAALFVLILTYSALNKVALYKEATGILVFEDPSLRIVLKHDIRIKRVLVKDNQKVEKDQPLLIARKQLSKRQVSDLLRQEKVVKSFLVQERKNGCGRACIRNIESLQSRSFNSVRGLNVEGAYQKYLEKLGSVFSEYIAALKQKNFLPKTTAGLSNQIRNLRQKIRSIEKKKAQNILKIEYEKLRSEVVSLNAQREEKRQQVTDTLNTRRENLRILLSSLKSNTQDYDNAHTITAPSKGVVSFKDVGAPGEFVPARTHLFNIVPVGAPLLARLNIQNADIADVDAGDRVKISINALSEREYGPTFGYIKSIATDPIQNEKSEPYFSAWTSLESQELYSPSGKPEPFKMGMTLEAKIITRHETLLRFIIRKLFNIKDEYLSLG